MDNGPCPIYGNCQTMDNGQWTRIYGLIDLMVFLYICSPHWLKVIMPPQPSPQVYLCASQPASLAGSLTAVTLSPCHPLSLRFKPIEPPEKSSLPSRTFLEEEEEESPRVGSCRPLSQVADSGPKSKVNYPFISALPSLKIYPCMCGLNLEPDSRPGLSPVNPSSTPGALTSRGQPNKGPADDYPPSKPQGLPNPGLAEGPKQLLLQQRPLPP